MTTITVDDRNALILPIVDAAIASTKNTGLVRSSSALYEAKRSLVLKPINTTGVAAFAIGALEGVLKQVGNGGNTIEHALRDNDWHPKFKSMVRACWAFANERARHISENAPEPSYDEALFLLQISCAIIMRILGSMHCQCCGVSSLKAEMARNDACVKCGGPKHGCDECGRCVEYVLLSEYPQEDGTVFTQRSCHECLERENSLGPPDDHPGWCNCDECFPFNCVPDDLPEDPADHPKWCRCDGCDELIRISNEYELWLANSA